MVFDDGPAQVPVSIRGKKYVLVEALEEGASEFRSAAAASQRIGDEGRSIRLEGVGELQTVLLSHCLKEVVGDKLRPVSKAAVKQLPSKVAKALFDRAKELSELSELPQTEESIDKQIEVLNRQKATLARVKNSREAATTSSGRPDTSGCSGETTLDGRLTAST